jgi:hypothetical protein
MLSMVSVIVILRLGEEFLNIIKGLCWVWVIGIVLNSWNMKKFEFSEFGSSGDLVSRICLSRAATPAISYLVSRVLSGSRQ